MAQTNTTVNIGGGKQLRATWKKSTDNQPESLVVRFDDWSDEEEEMGAPATKKSKIQQPVRRVVHAVSLS